MGALGLDIGDQPLALGPLAFTSTFMLTAGLVPQDLAAMWYYVGLGEAATTSVIFESFVRMSGVWLTINFLAARFARGITSFYTTDLLTNNLIYRLSVPGSAALLQTVLPPDLLRLARLGGTGVILRVLPVARILQSGFDEIIRRGAPASMRPEIAAFTNMIYRSAASVILVDAAISWIPLVTGSGGFAEPASLRDVLSAAGFRGTFDILASTPAFAAEAAGNFALAIGLQVGPDLGITSAPRLVTSLAALLGVYWSVSTRMRIGNLEYGSLHAQFDDVVPVDPSRPRSRVQELPNTVTEGACDFPGVPVPRTIEPSARSSSRSRGGRRKQAQTLKLLEDADRFLSGK